MSPHFLFDFVLSFILKTAFCMLFCSLLSFCSVNRTRSGYLLLSVCLSKCFFQLSHWIHQKFCICWIYCWKIDWNSGLSSPHFSQLNCRVWTGVRSVCTWTSALELPCHLSYVESQKKFLVHPDFLVASMLVLSMIVGVFSGWHAAKGLAIFLHCNIVLSRNLKWVVASIQSCWNIVL